MTSEIALHLVNTSVEDMKNSIECAESNGQPYTIYCLSLALGVVTKRKEITKAKFLTAKIKNYEKELERFKNRTFPI